MMRMLFRIILYSLVREFIRALIRRPNRRSRPKQACLASKTTQLVNATPTQSASEIPTKSSKRWSGVRLDALRRNPSPGQTITQDENGQTIVHVKVQPTDVDYICDDTYIYDAKGRSVREVETRTGLDGAFLNRMILDYKNLWYSVDHADGRKYKTSVDRWGRPLRLEAVKPSGRKYTTYYDPNNRNVPIKEIGVYANGDKYTKVFDKRGRRRKTIIIKRDGSVVTK